MKEVVFTKAKSFILVFTQNQNVLHDKGMLLQAAELFRTVPIAHRQTKRVSRKLVGTGLQVSMISTVL